MANKEIKLGNYIVNDKSMPYLIAEIGINHNGDLDIAKKLIDAVRSNQWNCAKFQKREPDISVPEAQKNVMRETPWGLMTYLDYKKKIEFSEDEYKEIDSYCKTLDVMWTASPWDLPSLEFLLQYDIPFIKIASACNNNWDILSKACESCKPILLSTGMSTLEEIDDVVEFLEKNTKGNYILLHTNSVYPTPQDELNLRMIRTLKERYNCLVGYSGHEMPLEPTVVAASIGACVIERHVTLDHNMWGTDQMASLEVRGMSLLRGRLQTIHEMLGDGRKVLTDKEVIVRKKLRGDM